MKNGTKTATTAWQKTRRNARRSVLALGGLLITVLVARQAHRPPRPPLNPPGDAQFTSSRYVTCLLAARDGTLWAGTLGGILQRSRGGIWQKYTRLQGLPHEEVRGLKEIDGQVVATFPTEQAVWEGGAWHTQVSEARPALDKKPASTPDAHPAAVWNGQRYRADAGGLWRRERGQWRLLGVPASHGTHVSALLPHGDALWAALYGDGLYAFNGKTWAAVPLALPPTAREITCLAQQDSTLWLGTRQAGLWNWDGHTWTPHTAHNEPFAHDCQSLAAYRGRLYLATLEDGLVVRASGGWGHVRAGTLTSDAPSQLLVCDNRLFARHSGGQVDVFDGAHWQQNITAGLPRPQATTLATDGQRLYVGVWGGWSELAGQTWTHHLNVPALQGAPVTALWPEKDRVWIGTQRQGVAEYRRATGEIHWHDERAGLPDDWVTGLLRTDDGLFAGTFVGGLARWDGRTWTTLPELQQENVTSLVSDEAGGLFVATRRGVWHRLQDGTLLNLNARHSFLDEEVQTLCHVNGGLWVGTRTGLDFLVSPE